jgi:ribonuclease-3 family protein
MRAEYYSPLVLAYLGDAVFELYIRAMLVSEANTSVNELHRRAREYVSAAAQAEMYHLIINDLTEEELAVMKRGRNAKANTARSMNLNDYRHATGLEALFGYLHMKGGHERLSWLFERCVSINGNGYPSS